MTDWKDPQTQWDFNRQVKAFYSLRAASLTQSTSCREREDTVLSGESIQDAVAVLMRPQTDSVTYKLYQTRDIDESDRLNAGDFSADTPDLDRRLESMISENRT